MNNFFLLFILFFSGSIFAASCPPAPASTDCVPSFCGDGTGWTMCPGADFSKPNCEAEQARYAAELEACNNPPPPPPDKKCSDGSLAPDGDLSKCPDSPPVPVFCPDGTPAPDNDVKKCPTSIDLHGCYPPAVWDDSVKDCTIPCDYTASGSQSETVLAQSCITVINGVDVPYCSNDCYGGNPVFCPDGTPAPDNDVKKCPKPPVFCPDGSAAPDGDVTKCPVFCPDGSLAPERDVKKCPKPPVLCPDGSAAPDGDVTKCPPTNNNNNTNTNTGTGTGTSTNTGTGTPPPPSDSNTSPNTDTDTDTDTDTKDYSGILSSIKSTLDSIKSSIDTGFNDLKQSTDDLKQSNTDLKQSTDDLKQSNTDLKQSTDDLKQSNTDLKQSTDDLKQSNTDLKTSTDNLKSSNDGLKGSTDGLKLSVDKLNDSLNKSANSNLNVPEVKHNKFPEFDTRFYETKDITANDAVHDGVNKIINSPLIKSISSIFKIKLPSASCPVWHIYDVFNSKIDLTIDMFCSDSADKLFRFISFVLQILAVIVATKIAMAGWQ